MARLTIENRGKSSEVPDGIHTILEAGEKAGVEELLGQSTRLARYHLRDQRDVGRLREDVLKLDTQQREERPESLTRNQSCPATGPESPPG